MVTKSSQDWITPPPFRSLSYQTIGAGGAPEAEARQRPLNNDP